MGTLRTQLLCVGQFLCPLLLDRLISRLLHGRNATVGWLDDRQAAQLCRLRGVSLREMACANVLWILTHDPMGRFDDVTSSCTFSSLPLGLVVTASRCLSLDPVWSWERCQLLLGSGYPVVGPVLRFVH